MSDPFDRLLPSPIAAVLAMRSSASESVAIAGSLSDRQQRVAVATGVEHAITEAVAGGDLRLVLVSGSAGDGKSFTIGNLLASPANPWAGHPERVIEDATHSERPSQEQAGRLRSFFAPLERDALPQEGPPLLIAMNTGMVIRFVTELQQDAAAFLLLQDLAEVLLGKLGVPHEPLAVPDPDFAESILVVNLDERPTTGTESGLLRGILRAFEPESTSGVMAGASRCGTCTVRAWCWVRTNAEILSDDVTATVIDTMVDRLALERGRPFPPRSLWDAAATIVMGGTEFGEPDPCDQIANLAVGERSEALRQLWRFTLPNSIFEAPQLTGLPEQMRDRDPTFLPGEAAHELIAEAGIHAHADAANLIAAVGGPVGRREAVQNLASAINRGELGASQDSAWRRSISRSLARAAILSGDLVLADTDLDAFSEILVAYASASGASSALVAELEELVGEALARSFGEQVQSETFFRTGKEADRTVAVHVRVDLHAGETHMVLDDPVIHRNPAGAAAVGYRPLAVEVGIVSDDALNPVSLSVNYALYSLLREACSGTLPSASALERFYSLRRAAAALGARAASDHTKPMLLADRRTGRRVRLELQDRRGSKRYREQEVV